MSPAHPAAISDLMDLAHAPRFERIAGIRSGLPAVTVIQLAKQLAFSQDRLFDMLALKRATIQRKVAAQSVLSPADSERVLGLLGLLATAESFAPYTRDPNTYDPAAWLASWLETPSPALGGTRPGGLLDTVEGQRIVRQLLEQQWSGAYA